MADRGNQGNYTPMAAIRWAPDVPGENRDFALRASASAILVFAAKVRFQFSSVTGLGRLLLQAGLDSGRSPEFQ